MNAYCYFALHPWLNNKSLFVCLIQMYDVEKMLSSKLNNIMTCTYCAVITISLNYVVFVCDNV